MHAVKARAVLGRARQQPSEQGQGLTEYALILVLIAMVAVLSLIFLGGQLSTLLSGVGNSV
jgi:Flp pilus assembly pilin Flp